MKTFLRTISIVFIIGYSAYSQAMITGPIYQETEIVPNAFVTTRANWASQKLAYTTGGVTFTYPAGQYTNPPDVSITVEEVSVPVGTNFVQHIVTSNSATSTTVSVHIGTITALVFTAFEEAPSGSVNVHLNAIGF